MAPCPRPSLGSYLFQCPSLHSSVVSGGERKPRQRRRRRTSCECGVGYARCEMSKSAVSFQSEVRYSKHRHAKRVMACELVWQDAMREWQSERVSSRRIFLGLHASPVWRQSAPNHFFFVDMHASLDWRDHPNCCPYLGKIIWNLTSILFPLSTPALQCCHTWISILVIVTLPQH